MNFSISQIAAKNRMGRDTVAKRLAEFGVKPADRVKGYDVFDIWDAARAIYGASDGDGIDPEKLSQPDKLAYWRSESERLKVGEAKGQLVQAADHETAVASVLKIVVQDYSVVADKAERELGIDSKLVDLLHKFFTARLEEFHGKLMALADE